MLFFDGNRANEHYENKDQKTSMTTSTLETLRRDLRQNKGENRRKNQPWAKRRTAEGTSRETPGSQQQAVGASCLRSFTGPGPAKHLLVCLSRRVRVAWEAQCFMKRHFSGLGPWRWS